MHNKFISIALSLASVGTLAAFASPQSSQASLNDTLRSTLQQAGFTGATESTLEGRLGRKLNLPLADLGRLLFFDVSGGLHLDNTCAGCHAPSAGFGDTQSIAIGVQNNLTVGPDRKGPRNQRRTPSVVNTAFYPNLMWNGRFAALSGDPFNNSMGFQFPLPEGVTRFPPLDPVVKQLLVAQAHIPPTELVEVAGFNGTRGTLGPLFDQFDDGKGGIVPAPDASGFRNEPIRQEVLKRLNGSAKYRQLFGQLFPEVAAGAPIDFLMFGRAIAEFEFTQVYATAPIDQFARGQDNAMTDAQKNGALVFFGKGLCSNCHSVSGQSNEMFSDFKMHNIGVPQIAPVFGVGKGNVIFDGPNADEDFGLEQVTGDPNDRYKFRSSPLRNAALQPAYFHDGAFVRLEDAIRHHLNVSDSALHYNPIQAGVALDLTYRVASPSAMLQTVDPILAQPINLTADEFQNLVAFVRDALLDPRAMKQNLCSLVPSSVPSGFPVLHFEACSNGLTILNYQLVSQSAASGTQSALTYRADLVNPGGALGAVTATLTSVDPFNLRVAPGQGTLNFPAVPANGKVTSSNTFTILVDPSALFDPNKLLWNFQTTGAPPVANPGSDQTVKVGSTVTLDGSGSGAGVYHWVFTSRPPGTATRLLSTESVSPSFVADVAGTYVITLTVSNAAGSTSANVTVTAVP